MKLAISKKTWAQLAIVLVAFLIVRWWINREPGSKSKAPWVDFTGGVWA